MYRLLRCGKGLQGVWGWVMSIFNPTRTTNKGLSSYVEALEDRIKILETRLGKWVLCYACKVVVAKDCCVWGPTGREEFNGMWGVQKVFDHFCDDCMDAASPGAAAKYRLEKLSATEAQKVLDCTRKVKHGKTKPNKH